MEDKPSEPNGKITTTELWKDEYRVPKGTAKWTENFTPPTKKLAKGVKRGR